MALLEGSEDCAATASGMAAVHAALMCQLKTGMRVVGSALLFGSCHWILTQLCPRFGIEVELVDGKDLAAWGRALGRKADLVFWNRPATRRSSWSTWRPSARSRIARVPRLSSTMYSPRRCCNGRLSWAPIYRLPVFPGTSMARGAASVV